MWQVSHNAMPLLTTAKYKREKEKKYKHMMFVLSA